MVLESMLISKAYFWNIMSIFTTWFFALVLLSTVQVKFTT